MTIIKAINELSNKMLLKCNFTKIRECEELSTVMDYFKLDKESAIIVATFICRRIEEDSSYFSIDDLERDWTLSLTEIISLIPNLDIILDKKIFLLRNKQPYEKGTANRSTQFIVDDNLIDILCYNKSFSEYEPDYDLSIKFDAIAFITDLRNIPVRVLRSKYNFSDYIRPFRKDPFIRAEGLIPRPSGAK